MADPNPAEMMNAIIDLHAAVSAGFARVDDRFERVEGRLASIEGEVAGLQRWRDRTDERLARLELHIAR